MAKTKAFLQKHRWSLTGALLGALVFLVLYGVRVLDPLCVDWILNNPSPDPSQHYLGWVFYRRSGALMYVHPGTGLWNGFPIRLGAASEIALIRLTRKQP